MRLNMLGYLAMQGAPAQGVEPLIQYLADFVMCKCKVKVSLVCCAALVLDNHLNCFNFWCVRERRKNLRPNGIIDMFCHFIFRNVPYLAKQGGPKLSCQYSSCSQRCTTFG